MEWKISTLKNLMMKIKLLKKIRKRYNWYFNKEKYPVLIDHKKKIAKVYDLEYCCKVEDIEVKSVQIFIGCKKTEWALRIMKRDILSQYGWKISRVLYKQANRIYKSK